MCQPFLLNFCCSLLVSFVLSNFLLLSLISLCTIPFKIFAVLPFRSPFCQPFFSIFVFDVSPKVLVCEPFVSIFLLFSLVFQVFGRKPFLSIFFCCSLIFVHLPVFWVFHHFFQIFAVFRHFCAFALWLAFFAKVLVCHHFFQIFAVLLVFVRLFFSRTSWCATIPFKFFLFPSMLLFRVSTRTEKVSNFQFPNAESIANKHNPA